MIDGHINRELENKTVEKVYKDGIWLIIRTTCGHEYKIGWTNDDNGSPLKGQPFLKQVDVKIILPSVKSFGDVWGTNHG